MCAITCIVRRYKQSVYFKLYHQLPGIAPIESLRMRLMAELDDAGALPSSPPPMPSSPLRPSSPPPMPSSPPMPPSSPFLSFTPAFSRYRGTSSPSPRSRARGGHASPSRLEYRTVETGFVWANALGLLIRLLMLAFPTAPWASLTLSTTRSVAWGPS